MLIAQRIGNPTLTSMSGAILGGALETTDPPRARSILETAIEHGTTVGAGIHVSTALGNLARMGTDAASPKWATRFRSALDLGYEAGDTRTVLMYARHVHAGARHHRPSRTRRDTQRSSG